MVVTGFTIREQRQRLCAGRALPVALPAKQLCTESRPSLAALATLAPALSPAHYAAKPRVGGPDGHQPGQNTHYYNRSVSQTQWRVQESVTGD